MSVPTVGGVGRLPATTPKPTASIELPVTQPPPPPTTRWPGGHVAPTRRNPGSLAGSTAENAWTDTTGRLSCAAVTESGASLAPVTAPFASAAVRTDAPPRSEASTLPDAILRPLTAPSRSARRVTAPVPSFVEVTARARSCFAPTLLGGRVSAYDPPPSATNNAQRATAIAGEGTGTRLRDIGHSFREREARTTLRPPVLAVEAPRRSQAPARHLRRSSARAPPTSRRGRRDHRRETTPLRAPRPGARSGGDPPSAVSGVRAPADRR